jgi:ABC-type transport system involved in multi-copper enzyme maturation permease subunit
VTGNPFAGTARVGWMEFWSHLKSPRLIILVVLLALLVFATSYGLSQSPTMGLGNSTNVYGHPAIRNESGVDHYLVLGWVADSRGTPVPGVVISVFKTTFPPHGSTSGELLENVSTNATGWVSVDVGTTMPTNVSFDLESGSGGGYGPGMAYVSFDPSLVNRTFTLGLLATTSSYSPSGSETVFFTHVTTIDGYPATGADIYDNGTLVGHPDANGYFSHALPPGIQTIKITFGSYNETYMEGGGTQTGPVYENGADAVLLSVTSFFGLLLPIAAIAISFDAVARERAQGSLEILLARKVRREGILAGKFLGAFASVALPVTLVILAGVGVLTAVSGKAPTGSFVAVVVLASLFLLAVYILLMLLFSTLAKSVGTAVVFGVVLWLFFNLLFSFLTVFVLFASGGSLFNSAAYGTVITAQLFDPNTVFTMLVSLAVPGSGGFTGLVPTGYVSATAVAGAAVLWLVVLTLLALVVFRKKAEG